MIIREAAGLKWFTEPGDNDDQLGPEHEATIEEQVLDLLGPSYQDRQFPDLGSVFLDIGAHVGHYTLRAAARGHRVIAVEANPETCGRLFANVVLNHLDGRVRIIPHPAWDEYQSLTYNHMGRERNASGQTRPDETGSLFPVILDDVLGTEKRIDVVKIDTEGAELHVLRGLRATLKRCRPVLWIENHDWLKLYSWQELADLLVELGYDYDSRAAQWSGLEYWLAEPTEG